VSFLPVLAYDGANMTQIDAGGILDIAMAGTSATLLARKWESALLVNVDNDTLRRILDVVARFRSLDAQTPVVLMGYANPVEAMGYDAFATRATIAVKGTST
jgi:hypothetical protein